MTRSKFYGLVDAAGDPVAVEPIPDARQCGCDEAKALRAELEEAKNLLVTGVRLLCEVSAERDYLLQFCDASEVLQMRKHLAAEWAARQGHLATGEQSDVEAIIGNG